MKPNKIEPPQKTYFYERRDGSIISAHAKEAWNLHKQFKQVGVSDGTAFYKAVQEAHNLFNTRGIEEAQERLRQGEKEEIEVARGHLEMPQNPDTIYPNGRPQGIFSRLI